MTGIPRLPNWKLVLGTLAMLTAVTALPVAGAQMGHPPDPCHLISAPGILSKVTDIIHPPKDCLPKPCDDKIHVTAQVAGKDLCHEQPPCDPKGRDGPTTLLTRGPTPQDECQQPQCEKREQGPATLLTRGPKHEEDRCHDEEHGCDEKGRDGRDEQWTRSDKKDDRCHDEQRGCDEQARDGRDEQWTRSDKKDDRCHDEEHGCDEQGRDGRDPQWTRSDKHDDRCHEEHGCGHDCEPTPPTGSDEPPTPPTTEVPFFPSAMSLGLGALGAIGSVIVAIRKKL